MSLQIIVSSRLQGISRIQRYPRSSVLPLFKTCFLSIFFIQKRKTIQKKVNLQTKKKETRQYASYIYSHLFSDIIFFLQCIAEIEEQTFYQLLTCAEPTIIIQWVPKRKKKRKKKEMATDNDINS